MNCFLGFLFCVFVTSLTSALSLNGYPPAAQIQRQKLKRFSILPAPTEESNNMSHFKHILEFNCLRELCNHVRYRRICYDLKPYQWFRFRQNQLRQRSDWINRNRVRINGRYNQNGILYVHPKVYFINKPVSLPLGQPSLLGMVPPNKNKQEPLGVKESRPQSTEVEEQVQSESHRIFVEAKETLPTETDPYQPPQARHSYEVKEIIEEKPEFGTNSTNFQNFYFHRRNLTERPVTPQNPVFRQPPIPEVQPKPNLRSRVLVEKQNEKKQPQSRQERLRQTPFLFENTGRLKPKETQIPIMTTLNQTTDDSNDTVKPTTDVFKSSSEPTKTREDQEQKDSPRPTESDKRLEFATSKITTNSIVWKRVQDYPNDSKFADHPEINTLPTEMDFQYFSQMTINEMDLTTPDFDEFQDEPLGFDLLGKIKADMKKDQDVISKNSRKMHFEQTPQDNEQRRSDILISENTDYDYENTFSGDNYLEKLKQNNPPRNLTSEEIITLIPVVINDVREGKIPSEDTRVLSEAFGKYWPMVLSLSNSSALDMLPLMKMRDETDLENVFKSFQAENPTKPAEVGNYSNFDYDLFDYIENYKELYKDNLHGDKSVDDILDVMDATPNSIEN